MLTLTRGLRRWAFESISNLLKCSSAGKYSVSLMFTYRSASLTATSSLRRLAPLHIHVVSDHAQILRPASAAPLSSLTFPSTTTRPTYPPTQPSRSSKTRFRFTALERFKTVPAPLFQNRQVFQYAALSTTKSMSRNSILKRKRLYWITGTPFTLWRVPAPTTICTS